jgi:hypothetical protein
MVPLFRIDLRASLPRRAMMASLIWRGREPVGWRWMASVTAQRTEFDRLTAR